MICNRISLLVLFVAATAFGVHTPTHSMAADKAPIKVFILAGQSNMQGHGFISMDKDGDLNYAARQEPFSYLKKDGNWVERQDVWYYHKATNRSGVVVTQCNLKPGLGAGDTKIGPELGFGHVLGNHFEEQVLLIKCAWGGQALGMPFRPPSAGLPADETLQAMVEKARKKKPELTIEEFKLNYGLRYRQTLSEVKEVLSNLKENFPGYQGQGYEIAGFFWHQGWNDATNKSFAQEYESNMTHFIKDIRKDLGNEELPFVIATSGMGGPDATGVAGFMGRSIEPAQINAAKKYDHCIAVPTRHFQKHKPGRQKSHWHNSAECYILVGDASGKAMIKILNGE